MIIIIKNKIINDNCMEGKCPRETKSQIIQTKFKRNSKKTKKTKALNIEQQQPIVMSVYMVRSMFSQLYIT